MKIVKKQVTLPEDKRIFVVSDIHGHYTWLEKLLKRVNFQKEDILFIVGDYIEKGPESLKTLRYVMKLCEAGNVYPSIGNVDLVRLQMLEGTWAAEELLNYINFMRKHWGTCFFEEMCREIKCPLNDVRDVVWAKAAVRHHFQKELDFLRSLPTLIETQKFIFVHGGLPASGTEGLEAFNAYDLLKNDAFMEKGLSFDKYIVVGHWLVLLYSRGIPSLNPVVDTKQKIISMDGGCGVKAEGQLNLLTLDMQCPENICFQSYDELPVLCAKTAQAASLGSIFIKWTDNKIEVLDRRENAARVRHRTSGRELDIPYSFIYDIDGDAKSMDYTDYRLQIEKGDRLSLIRKTPLGYFVKKNGVIGWFFGEAELCPDLQEAKVGIQKIP